MTVRELIDKLQRFEPDRLVILPGGGTVQGLVKAGIDDKPYRAVVCLVGRDPMRRRDYGEATQARRTD